MPPVKRKTASASNVNKKFREEKIGNISDEVDKLLDGLAKVKEEEVDYSDKIKEKIFKNMDEEDLLRPKSNVNYKKLHNFDKVVEKVEVLTRKIFCQ